MLEVGQFLESDGIVAVIRKMNSEIFPAVVEALITGGIRVLEVTLDGEHALEQIEYLNNSYSDKVVVGAGTVLAKEQLERALGAGIQFAVCPHLDVPLFEYALNHDCALIPGAFTPTEIYTAVKAGAQAVKVFPAATLGPEYVRNILGPFDTVKVMVTGGVSERNISDFFQAGAVAAGLGSALFPREDVLRQDWQAISARARTVVELAAQQKAKKYVV